MILAAAIRGEDGTIWTLPPPARHHDIGRYMCENGHPAPFPGGDDQGFIAGGEFRGRELPVYVRRVPAMRIARENNQILLGKGQHRELFSEDLW